MYVRSGVNWALQQKLLPSDGSVHNYFGAAAALSGDTVVVGDYFGDAPGVANSGAAYVFVRSGNTWTQQQKLTAPDAAADDLFGGSVTIFGNTAIVGAKNGDAPGVADAGAAYVFVRSGTTWTFQQKVTASIPQTNAYFGGALSLFGETVIVGAEGVVKNGMMIGAAYAFVRSGTSWTQQHAFSSSGEGTHVHSFGGSVAIHGETAVIAARNRHFSQGAVDVFVRSGTVWTKQQELFASDAALNAQFGTSVSVYGHMLTVGSYTADVAGWSNAGAAYTFERVGTSWTERQRLAASDPGEEDAFGVWTSNSPDLVVIGAFADDTPAGDDTGSVFVFRRAPARYFPVTPCRAVNTVATGMPLAANTTRTFAIGGICGVPADAKAVMAILVAIDPNDGGNLTLYPAGHPLPLASMMNFRANRTRHGSGTVPLGASGQVNVRCTMVPASTGTTHFALDVVGYYK